MIQTKLMSLSLSLSLHIAVDPWKLAERVTRDIRRRISNASSRYTYLLSQRRDKLLPEWELKKNETEKKNRKK